MRKWEQLWRDWELAAVGATDECPCVGDCVYWCVFAFNGRRP